MGKVLADNVWVDREMFRKGATRDSLDPNVAALVGSHLWVDEVARPNVSPTGFALTGLKDNVWVDGTLYTKGSIDIPPDVIPKIGDHMWVDGKPPEVLSGESGQGEYARGGVLPERSGSTVVASEPELVVTPEPNPSTSTPPEPATPAEALEPPPQGGPRGSKAAWEAYARELGVSVPVEAKRDAIVDAVRDAGFPVD